MSTPEMAVVVPAYNEERTIERTLQGLYVQDEKNFMPILVDNASTDGTMAAAGRFMSSHPDFPLRIVEEGRKGTGYACNAGFEAAISAGASIIARTDADTVPRNDWAGNIQAHFARNPELRLLSGPTRALQDEWYRPCDRMLWPASVMCARLLFSAKWQSLSGLKLAIGHNSSTDAETYEEIGGFSDSSIDSIDEDLAYSRAVGETYGTHTMSVEPDVVVRTSMRRLRKIGYHRSFVYYGINPGPDYRNQVSGGTVDIR